MGRPTKSKPKTKASKLHRVARSLLVCLATLSIILAIVAVGSKVQSNLYQKQLEPFYSTAGLPVDGPMGEIVRQEPLKNSIPGGKGIRILYRTQRSDNSPTFTSGMVFIPSNAATQPRPVVTWAHGSLGLGDVCTPSRARKPGANMAGLEAMLKNGWVVTATDYAGFGTLGTQGYLVGGAEANDVINSVRAARNVADSQAGTQYTIWGHSQGGHSALFASSQANTYAPELQLKGTVASAPAAELPALLNEQYGGVADWVIGPLISVSWPAVNSDLNVQNILTPTGQRTYQGIANECIKEATILGLLHSMAGEKFMSNNPAKVSGWQEMAEQQTAPLLKPNQPLMVIESKADKVVLPNTTALYIQKTCSAGNNLSSLWLDKAAHQDIPKESAAQVVSWLSDRFAGQPVQSTCSQPSPITPYGM